MTGALRLVTSVDGYRRVRCVQVMSRHLDFNRVVHKKVNLALDCQSFYGLDSVNHSRRRYCFSAEDVTIMTIDDRRRAVMIVTQTITCQGSRQMLHKS